MKLVAPLLKPTNSVFAQLLRYGAVGVVASGVDFSLLIALTELGTAHYYVSAAIAFAAGLVTNYCLSTLWVFSARGIEDRYLEFTIFALIGLAGLAWTELVLWIGTEVMGCDYRLAKIAAVVLVLAWNFGLRKAVLFRKSPSRLAT